MKAEAVNSQPSKLWAYVAVVVGGLLLLSGAAAVIGYLGLPFSPLWEDVLGLQLGQMAGIFLGLVCGALAVYHGLASIRNRVSRPLTLPPVYLFWLAFALVLGLGNVLLNFHVAEDFLFPPLFLLGAALPTVAVLAWAGRRLGWPVTWRQGAMALVAGSTLSIFVAIALETVLSLVVLFLLGPLVFVAGSFGEVVAAGAPGILERLFFSPLIVVFLIATALQAPIPEEFAKALGVTIFGRKRITNERQAFMIGLACGAGFAILENMLYEGLYAQQSGWSWGGVTLLRGLGSVMHPVATALVALGWYRARERGWTELAKAYLAAVGLHTLWNGGFEAFVYLTGLDYYSGRPEVVSIYGLAVEVMLVVFLAALSLALWWLLRRLVTSIAAGIEPDVVPTLVSPRAVAAYAFACALIIIPIGAALGPASGEIQAVVLAGPPTPTPTNTPTPTPTVMPTDTPTPTTTATPFPTPIGWTLVLLDPLDSDYHGWPTGHHSDLRVTGDRLIADGKYRWKARAHQNVAWWGCPRMDSVTDFHLTVEAKQVSGSADAEYGVIFRQDGEDYYLFMVTDRQAFHFSMRYQGEWISLIDRRTTFRVRPGEMNRLTVIAEGSHFTFLVNGQTLAEADDSRLGRGVVGVAIQLRNRNDGGVFEFDNFELRTPALPTPTPVPPTPTSLLPTTAPELVTATPVPPTGVSPIASPAEITTAPGGWIAFVSDRDGNDEIYKMRADGSQVTRLTDNAADDGDPSWSPDGVWIAFVSDRDGNDEIYRMRADGSQVTRLTEDPAVDSEPSWSPDGVWIAFVSYRDGNDEIYRMENDGSQVTNLTDNRAWDSSPSWSPDGNWIAFTSGRDGNREIYKMRADGSETTNLTSHPAGDSNPSWSPDGNWIAFQAKRNGNYDIYKMRADGSSVTRLTDSVANDLDASWSPDGNWLAYGIYHIVLGGSRYEEVYKMRSDGSEVTRLTERHAADGDPAWGP